MRFLFRTSLALLVLAFAAPPLRAAENAYDTLARVLLPIAGLFAQNPKSENRALSLSVRVEESHGFPVDLAGQRAELDVEYPDKLRLHAPVLGKSFTIGRRGSTVWVSPGSELKAFLTDPEFAKKLPAPDRNYQLKPFGLPIPEKDLVFLPGLFQAHSAPAETVDGIPCQVLDLRITPIAEKAAGVNRWSGRAWVGPEARLVRLALTGPDTSLVLRFDRLLLSKTLPPATWVPAPGEEGDVLLVPPARYDQLLRAVLGGR